MVDDHRDELGMLHRFAESLRERHARRQPSTELLADCGEHRCVDDARRDRADPDAMLCEVAGSREGRPDDDAAFGRGVRNLADLPVVRCD